MTVISSRFHVCVCCSDNWFIAFQALLPEPVPVHHLGLFREKTTLQPVEYYNNLPTRVTPNDEADLAPCDLAIVVDPVIATGGTAEAAIQTLKEWGVAKVCTRPPTRDVFVLIYTGN